MKKILVFLFSLSLLACNQEQEKVNKTATLITNVHIVDVRNGKILENHQILVDSGKIIQMGPSIAGKYANTIDGNRAFAVPGLAEMHAHIPSPPTSEERIKETLFLYLSNGITTIRGMLGHPRHLELREEAESGSLLSPRIFTSSPSLNGNSVKTPEEARSKVTAYKEAGYDFLKIHPGILRAVFDTLVKTANEVGIPFAGHVPVDVGIRHALKSQFASIDHVDGYLEGLVPKSAAVEANQNGFFGYNFTPITDSSLIQELVAESKKQGVWVVPTQSLFERWFAPAESDQAFSPGNVALAFIAAGNTAVGIKFFGEAKWSGYEVDRSAETDAVSQGMGPFEDFNAVHHVGRHLAGRRVHPVGAGCRTALHTVHHDV